jgi:hypothetical protein|tara:strand:+ start:3411 stop:3746 length:336 start_codon:yes stop_codon:yes gene_type:complete
MANNDESWTITFAWWRRTDAYVDRPGFMRMEVYPEIINHMGFSVDRTTFIEEAQDVGARMYGLSGLLPGLTARQLRDLAESGSNRVFRYEEGLDSNGDPAYLITVGIDEEE